MDLSTFLDRTYSEIAGEIEGTATHLSADQDELRVGFQFTSSEGDMDAPRRVQLVFAQVVESSLRVGFLGNPLLHRSHPLLLDHVEPTDDLYFSSRPPSPLEIIGALHQVHVQAVGTWRPLARYLISSPDFLAAGSGLLARGPRSLIAKYNDAVGELLRTSLIQSTQSPITSKLVVVFSQRHYIVCGSAQVAA